MVIQSKNAFLVCNFVSVHGGDILKGFGNLPVLWSSGSAMFRWLHFEGSRHSHSLHWFHFDEAKDFTTDLSGDDSAISGRITAVGVASKRKGDCRSLDLRKLKD